MKLNIVAIFITIICIINTTAQVSAKTNSVNENKHIVNNFIIDQRALIVGLDEKKTFGKYFGCEYISYNSLNKKYKELITSGINNNKDYVCNKEVLKSILVGKLGTTTYSAYSLIKDTVLTKAILENPTWGQQKIIVAYLNALYGSSNKALKAGMETMINRTLDVNLETKVYPVKIYYAILVNKATDNSEYIKSPLFPHFLKLSICYKSSGRQQEVLQCLNDFALNVNNLKY